MGNTNSSLPILKALLNHFEGANQHYITSLELQRNYGVNNLDAHLPDFKSLGFNLVKIELSSGWASYFIANNGLIVIAADQLKELLMTYGLEHECN